MSTYIDPKECAEGICDVFGMGAFIPTICIVALICFILWVFYWLHSPPNEVGNI